jgi:ribonuclease P protein component
VTGSGSTFARLKKRRDFLLAAKGRKAGRRAFLLESRRRDDDGPARFGFTISKRVSKKAVERNRIRRRLREAVRLFAAGQSRPGHDYVLVGRRAALNESFRGIAADLASALGDDPGPVSKRGRHGARSSSA